MNTFPKLLRYSDHGIAQSHTTYSTTVLHVLYATCSVLWMKPCAYVLLYILLCFIKPPCLINAPPLTGWLIFSGLLLATADKAVPLFFVVDRNGRYQTYWEKYCKIYKCCPLSLSLSLSFVGQFMYIINVMSHKSQVSWAALSKWSCLRLCNCRCNCLCCSNRNW